MWDDPSALRNLFDGFAKHRGFDPVNADNWYSVPIADLDEWAAEAKTSINNAYSGFRNALRKAYPEIEFSKWKRKCVIHLKFFPFFNKAYILLFVARENRWRDPKRCRMFFDRFAKKEGFDALDVKNWYSPNVIREMKKQPVTIPTYLAFSPPPQTRICLIGGLFP